MSNDRARELRVLLHAFANVVTDRDGNVEDFDHPDFMTASHSLVEKFASETARADAAESALRAMQQVCRRPRKCERCCVG